MINLLAVGGVNIDINHGQILLNQRFIHLPTAALLNQITAGIKEIHGGIGDDSFYGDHPALGEIIGFVDG